MDRDVGHCTRRAIRLHANLFQLELCHLARTECVPTPPVRLPRRARSVRERALVVCGTAAVAGEHGIYKADSRPDSTEPPVGGDYVYWDHEACGLDMANGVCR